MLGGCFDKEQQLEQELTGAPLSCFVWKNSCRFRVGAAHKFSIGISVVGGLYGNSRKWLPSSN